MRLEDLPKHLVDGCGAEEALSELQREAQVRSRIHPKWIDDGRLSKYDARDRDKRMAAAIAFLQWLVDFGTLMRDPEFMPGQDVKPMSPADVAAKEGAPF